MREKRGSTTSLGAAMSALVQSLGIDQKLREYDAVVRWEQIVGEQIARVTRPDQIVKGVLVVHVTASAWRQELMLRKAEIIRRLNDDLGADLVKDIRFR